VALSPHFRQSLHNALTGSGDHASFGQESTAPDKHLVTQAMLDQYATERWEAVLHYLVGSPSGKRKRAVTKLLEHSGLMARANLTITSKGFQFLLQDVNVQVWAFLLQYLQMSDELKMDLVEVLGFLFQLGSLRFGASYSVDTLTETQKHMLEDLKPLGIVYQRKKKSSRFYPTRLATTLTSKTLLSSGADGDSATGHAAGGQSLTGEETGFIIVETNYRVYAYTSSALEIAVLSLFVNLKARFMNMVVGMITRDSVREALSKGISATQIIDYLTSQAHPELKKNNPVLPATVSDQIRLWEMEKERITPSHAWLYRDFARQDDYEATVAYAEAYNFVLWKNPTNRIIVVDARGQDQVR
ncbi:transcription factor Tfb2, partial [Caulochytrium protostelioides]